MSSRAVACRMTVAHSQRVFSPLFQRKDRIWPCDRVAAGRDVRSRADELNGRNDQPILALYGYL